jgi:predicted TIM-barrel fold metal-dependent hydrolase
MSRIGVDAAIAYHVVAREYSPRLGNGLLTQEIEGQRALGAAWILLPHQTGEFPAPDALIPEMRQAGVVMARMHPSTDAQGHRYLLADWVVGDLLDALAEADFPLAIDFSLFRRSEPPWELLVQVLQAHQALRVILMDVQGRNNRTLYPLLERFPNLAIQTAGLNVHRGIEDVVNRFGAQRLVFGSGYPLRSMGAARFQLESAEISDADRRLIGAGNMVSLMGTHAIEKFGAEND